jgi:hypothetical protein
LTRAGHVVSFFNEDAAHSGCTPRVVETLEEEKMMSIRTYAVALGFVCFLTPPALAGVITTVDVVAAVGQVAPGGGGGTFTTFNTPFTNGLGQVGFTGNLSVGGPYVFHTNQVIWVNADGLPDHVLTGTEGTMGISDAGGFIYSPSTDGQDSVYTHNGLLLRGTDPAPGLVDLWATFNSRPRMTPDGTAWWVAGFSNTKGGGTQGRILYKCADTADPSSSVPVLTTMDAFLVEGNMHMPTTSGIGFGYDMSENSMHAINELTLAGLPTTSNAFIWVDGALVHRQGDPVGDGTNWNSFRGPSINNNGDYTFGGATSGGPAANQEFLAYNGNIILRRGDIVDGIELAGTWATRWTSINNLGQIAHIWEAGTSPNVTGTLFVTLDPNDAINSTVALVSAQVPIDTTGNGVADALIADFEASATIAPGLDFSDHPWVYIEVELRDIDPDSGGLGAPYEAIIRVPFPQSQVPCPGDLDGNWTVDVFDLLILLAAWGPCPGCPEDLDNSGVVDVFDLLILLSSWGPCL